MIFVLSQFLVVRSFHDNELLPPRHNIRRRRVEWNIGYLGVSESIVEYGGYRQYFFLIKEGEAAAGRMMLYYIIICFYSV